MTTFQQCSRTCTYNHNWKRSLHYSEHSQGEAWSMPNICCRTRVRGWVLKSRRLQGGMWPVYLLAVVLDTFDGTTSPTLQCCLFRVRALDRITSAFVQSLLVQRLFVCVPSSSNLFRIVLLPRETLYFSIPCVYNLHCINRHVEYLL